MVGNQASNTLLAWVYSGQNHLLTCLPPSFSFTIRSLVTSRICKQKHYLLFSSIFPPPHLPPRSQHPNCIGVQPPWFGIVRMTPTHQNTIRSQSSESHFSGRKLYHLEFSWLMKLLHPGESSCTFLQFHVFLAPENRLLLSRKNNRL